MSANYRHSLQCSTHYSVCCEHTTASDSMYSFQLFAIECLGGRRPSRTDSKGKSLCHRKTKLGAVTISGHVDGDRRCNSPGLLTRTPTPSAIQLSPGYDYDASRIKRPGKIAGQAMPPGNLEGVWLYQKVSYTMHTLRGR